MYVILAILIILILASSFYLLPRLKIITGYAAKSMCSCVFVAKRTPQSVLDQDLNFSFLKYAKAWVNEDEKTAYATIFGLAKRKAVFREGLGCSLVFDENDSELPDQFVPHKTVVGNDTLSWPYGSKTADTVFSEVDYEKLQLAVDSLFDKEGELIKNTRVVLVVYKDQIIAEKYAPGFDEHTPQLGWSMTKSLTNAMVGLLVQEGKLALEQDHLLPEWSSDDRSKITLNNLLQMSSGLEWNEEYGDQSDATLMLYRKVDKSGYAASRSLTNVPGSTWVYSSGTTNIIQKIIRNTFEKDEDYWQYPYENLFSKIGMSSTFLEADNTGTFVGSSYGYATPRDWAKFGLLYLHNGVWGENRILPEGWVEYSKSPTEVSEGEYGAHFWSNSSKKYPTAPPDMFLCQGFHGQRIFIIPSKEMVIVRMGVSEDGTFDFDEMLSGILEAVN